MIRLFLLLYDNFSIVLFIMDESPVNQPMQSKDIQEKIGKTLFIGFDGSRFSEKIKNLLLDIRPGGIVLFKRNAEEGPREIADLISSCQEVAINKLGRRLLVAIDQEGGSVIRLGAPFSQLPALRKMAETLSPDQVRELGRTSGQELFSVGINMNLAPVMDIQTEVDAVFMSSRSTGPDEGVAAKLGLALIAGHAQGNVLTCAKHFPGIGDVKTDPHLELPIVEHSENRILSKEIQPFKAAIDAGVAAVMTAHVVFPGLDPENPGTFSPKILTEMLRKNLNFEGLILTDDLEMGAVVKNYSVGRAAVMTLQAGADMALICRRENLITEAGNAIVEAVNSGIIDIAQIEASNLRLEKALDKCTLPAPDMWREIG